MKPTPGSQEAVADGCVCPVMDNAHGRGARGSEGPNAVFWIAGDCPVHAISDVDRENQGQLKLGE